MTKKKQTIERISWSHYQQIIQAERNRWIKEYGEQRSRRFGFSKRTNAQRVDATHVGRIPLEDIEKELVAYQARNPIARFVIRLFTNIEKKRALYHYQMTINTFDKLLSPKFIPLNSAALQEHFSVLKNHVSSQISYFSRLGSLQKNLYQIFKQKQLIEAVVISIKLTDSEIDSTTTHVLSQLALPMPDLPNSASETMPLLAPVKPITPTPQPMVKATDIAKQSAFNQQFLQDESDFKLTINKTKQTLQVKVEESRRLYPNDAKQVSIQTQMALADASKALKKSFHKLSLRYHPDKVNDVTIRHLTEEAFKTMMTLYSKGLDSLADIITNQIKPEEKSLYQQTEDLKAEMEELRRETNRLTKMVEELEAFYRNFRKKMKADFEELAKSRREIAQMQKENLEGFREVRQSYGKMFTQLDDLKAQVDLLEKERTYIQLSTIL